MTSTSLAAVAVRSVRAHEHVRLGEITVAAYRSLPGWLDHPDERVVADNMGYEAELADVPTRVTGGCDVLVAVRSATEDVLGGVTFVPSADNPYNETPKAAPVAIRHLAIDPAAQRQGIGRMLVDACIARARHIGAPAIAMHTLTIMTGAMAMYESMGFVRAPEHDEWWDGVEGIAYVLELT
jgi:GNAT superfamily N-acetyltransferase